MNVGAFFAILPSLAAAQVGRLKTSGVIGMMHDATSGRFARRAKGVTLLLALALIASCTPSAPGPASESFRKEVLAARDSLAPALMDAVASREPRLAKNILDQKCALAKEDGSPFACGITILDHHGITLASATLAPGEPIRRLDYSRYEVVMTALKERKVVKARLFLQDGTKLYVVAIPLVRNEEAIGLLGLAFDASDLRDRFNLTEDEFMRVDLNG